MSSEGYNVSQTNALPTGRMLTAIGAFSGMAMLCLFDLTILISTKFRRRSLYFWSMVAATFGAFLFNLGLMLFFFVFGISQPWVVAILTGFGYLIFVPAQFLVLYSRLYVLSVSERIKRFVLVLGITEVLLVALPLDIIATAALVVNSQLLSNIYSYMQRIEVCVYSATMITISAIYLYQVSRTWPTRSEPKTRRALKQLISGAIFIIFLDISNVAMEFSKNSGLQNGWIVC
jgi:hypothetical protein